MSARLPLVLERYQVSFDAFSLPSLPAPIVLVHTAGKPVAYRVVGDRRSRQSLPGLVTFVPAAERAEVSLRGVGEGMVVHFDIGPVPLPVWLCRSRFSTPTTFTNDVIVAVVRRLLQSADAHAVADDRHRRALGNALLAELRAVIGRDEVAVAPAPTRSRLHLGQAASAWMQSRLDQPIRVADVARACGMGVTGFSNGFRLATGVTPHRHLRSLRIERACELLRTTALSVLEVAEAVGFRGQAHFCTVFVTERGLTPTAYRRGSRRVSRPTARGRRAER